MLNEAADVHILADSLPSIISVDYLKPHISFHFSLFSSHLCFILSFAKCDVAAFGINFNALFNLVLPPLQCFHTNGGVVILMAGKCLLSFMEAKLL